MLYFYVEDRVKSENDGPASVTLLLTAHLQEQEHHLHIFFLLGNGSKLT